MRQIALPCLAVAAAATLSAKDVYVSTRGSDTNAGTRQEPLASLQKALTAMREAPPRDHLAGGG